MNNFQKAIQLLKSEQFEMLELGPGKKVPEEEEKPYERGALLELPPKQQELKLPTPEKVHPYERGAMLEWPGRDPEEAVPTKPLAVTHDIKPIHEDPSHPAYKNFSWQDHADAHQFFQAHAQLHKQLAEKLAAKGNKKGADEAWDKGGEYSQRARQHYVTAFKHLAKNFTGWPLQNESRAHNALDKRVGRAYWGAIGERQFTPSMKHKRLYENVHGKPLKYQGPKHFPEYGEK